MTSIDWQAQAIEALDCVDRMNKCMEIIQTEVEAELGIEDATLYNGGLLGALQHICKFKLEEVGATLDRGAITNRWQKIIRKHKQVNFLRMLVIVQSQQLAGSRTGYVESMALSELKHPNTLDSIQLPKTSDLLYIG